MSAIWLKFPGIKSAFFPARDAMKGRAAIPMDLLKSQLQKPLVLGGTAFLAGLFLGWLLLGWTLFPVQYVNGDPSQLRADFQQDYVKAAADSYVVTGDAAAALRRAELLGEGLSPALEGAVVSSSGDELFRLRSFEDAVRGALSPAPGEAPVEGESPAAAGGGLSGLLLPICGILLFVGLATAGGLYVRNRLSSRPPRPAMEPTMSPQRLATVLSPSAMATPPPAVAGQEPIAQWLTTYMLGDDLYDDSFSIDAQSGDFLGECGVGISETIGVGDPKKVTAFEVWLFDKNDIRTVTRVLMSEHAFKDEGLKNRLAAKGEPVLAQPGGLVQMETASLLITARVVDLSYGGGALPPSSYFDRMTVELSAYTKPREDS